MISSLRQLFRRRDLLFMLVWREVKIRYKQSVMGVLWAVLMPAVIVASGIVVKLAISFVAQQPFRLDELAQVSVKAVPWAFFVGSLRFALSRSWFFPVTKIYARARCLLAPRLRGHAGAAAAGAWRGAAPQGPARGCPPLGTPSPSCSAVVGAITAAGPVLARRTSVGVRDVAIFFTPVFYDEHLRRLASYLLLNPVAPILEGLAATVVRHEAPHPGWILYSTVFALTAAVLALQLFNWLDPYFAESI